MMKNIIIGIVCVIMTQICVYSYGQKIVDPQKVVEKKRRSTCQQ